MVEAIKQRMAALRLEHYVWKGILFQHYAYAGCYNEKNKVYLSSYECTRLNDAGVTISFTPGLKMDLHKIEHRCKEIKKEISQLNRILAYINRINEITEDRNYWRLKCKIQIGEMHLYPEFLRLQNERREKRLPI